MFFEHLDKFGDQTALIEGDNHISYQSLSDRVEAFSFQSPLAKPLVLLKGDNSSASITAYLAALQRQIPVILINQDTAGSQVQGMIDRFGVNVLVEGDTVTQCHPQAHSFDPRLRLLLATSGSTGTEKYVALSGDNLHTNAASICGYLPIVPKDRAITSLPLSYAYGLSVLNSHLMAGSTLVLTNESLVSRQFWQLFEDNKVTSLAGVPYTYEMFIRLRLHRKDFPSLRYITQAGGKMAGPVLDEMLGFTERLQIPLFIMYGQTEATARISYLAPHKVRHKGNSIGTAIDGGQMSLETADGKEIQQNHSSGELVYRGPNVMLGYCQTPEDLEALSFDGPLRTGDLAYRDDEGDYFISGRMKRFIKPFGRRLNLDDVEALLASQGISAAVVGDDSYLGVVTHSDVPQQDIQQQLSQHFALHHSVIKIRRVSDIPVLPSGKHDYTAMGELFNQRQASGEVH